MKTLRWALIGSLMTSLSFGVVACSDDDDDGPTTEVDNDNDEKDAGGGKEPGEEPGEPGNEPGNEPGDKKDSGTNEPDPEMDSGGEEPEPEMTEEDYLEMLDDHPSVSCDKKICTIESGEMTDDLTLYDFPDVVVQLATDDKYVFIGDDDKETVLTLLPGVTVYASGKTALVIQRGSKLMAEGTKDKPVVLTSAAEVGERKTGDWGGLIINGRATTNKGENVVGEANSGTYGGDDDEDSSGSLKYLRVEFAGNKVDMDNELNGIAFQGVGSGTEVDYIQVHYNQDDGVEFFGGTVSVKHVVLTGIGDDNFDWTDGWTGTAQFVFAEQGDEGDNGIEGDNQGSMIDATPISTPILGNFTLVGSDNSGEGVQLRAGTHGELWNSLVTGFKDGCFTVETEPSLENVAVKNTVLACGSEDLVFGHDDEGTPADVEESQGVFEADDSNSVVDGVDDLDLDGWVPKKDSVLLGADAPSSKLEETDYIGAFDEDEDWTEGWIETKSK